MNANVAQKYAQALFLTVETQYHQKAEQLVMIAQQFTQQPIVFRLLEDPRLSIEQKNSFLQETCQGADQIIIEFMQLVVKNQRVREISAIADYFEALVLKVNGQQKATVTTATKLDEATLATLITAVETKTATKLVATHVVDPSIIGGVKVSVGAQTFDDSFATKLQKLQSDLQKMTV
ncbi:MAG: ATP synthase F1 subunit delta [Culicoidibacterales bacterium]